MLESFHAAAKSNDGPLVAYKVEELASSLREEFGETTEKESAPLCLSICRELAEQIKGDSVYAGPEYQIAKPIRKPAKKTR